MHGRISLLLALLAAAALPAAAGADTTVAIEHGSYAIVDATGVANDLTVAVMASPARLQVVEAGGTPLQAVSPCTQHGATEVRCPDQGVWQTSIRLGGGDDRLSTTSDVHLYADAGDGNDTMLGGPRSDVLSGGAGNDLLAGHGGTDELRGGAGDDVLDGWSGADEPDMDARLECGDGDDDADPEAGSDWTNDCEVVAPEFVRAPIVGGTFTTGQTIFPYLGDALAGTYPTEMAATWMSCDAAGCGTPVAESWGLLLPASMAGRRLVASVVVRNRAGEDRAITTETPSIAAGTVWTPPAPTPRVRTRPPARPVEPREVLVPRVVGQLNAALPAVVRALERRDPRRIGPQGVRVRFATPVNGDVGLRWTVPAAVARRHGVRPASGRPLVVARAHRPKVRTRLAMPYDLAPTPLGRRLLARAPTLRLTLTVRVVPTALRPARAIDVRTPFTLRRR